MGKKKFKRQGSSDYKRVDDKWRKPKGMDSKMRIEKKGKPSLPKVGYKKPESERGFHPSGFREVLVKNPQEVEEVDPQTEAARIASSVGKRKRQQIVETAEERGVKVLNAKRRERNEAEDAEEISS
ncbi:50S ribosomal protein L32 [candidate division MSBL1 archaeon SCGC-AAA259O05]|uniref:Large ribosomal subunit protein eL32 n=1 Tax=candidate division MSBL1 archaeon SCGC-AAA259O05 TaxID=1698271 RepID=A0A133V3M7_9EURY|nr:50S ribosomal protein L32 [candidate division MSBL1 archaeon SCGC-AAA259O05]